jgi:hypothetical protein
MVFVYAYQATFAWRVWRNDRAAVSIEAPFLASPAFEVRVPGNSLPKEYASLYLTPGVRVTVPVRGALSAFVAGGAGYARYSESKLRRDDRAPTRASRTAIRVHCSSVAASTCGPGRGSASAARSMTSTRVHTGARRFSIPTPGPPVHNVVVSTGLVLQF